MRPQPLDYQAAPAKNARGVRASHLAVATAGMVLGALLWALSPSLVGTAEAWDDLPYYVTGLFLAGLIAACFGPCRFWVAPLGVCVGQARYAILFLPGGTLWIIGVVFGAAYAVVALAGATVPFVISLARRPRRNAAA